MALLWISLYSIILSPSLSLGHLIDLPQRTFSFSIFSALIKLYINYTLLVFHSRGNNNDSKLNSRKVYYINGSNIRNIYNGNAFCGSSSHCCEREDEKDVQWLTTGSGWTGVKSLLILLHLVCLWWWVMRFSGHSPGNDELQGRKGSAESLCLCSGDSWRAGSDPGGGTDTHLLDRDGNRWNRTKFS